MENAGLYQYAKTFVCIGVALRSLLLMHREDWPEAHYWALILIAMMAGLP